MIHLTGARLGLGALAAICLCLALPGATVAANAASGLWRDVSERAVPSTGAARRIVPARYRTVRLDRARFAQLMQRVPQERDRRPADSAAELELPMPDGSFSRFRIVESPVMEAGLAKRYPQIRTWAGQGIDDPDATARLDFTPGGFHAQVLATGGTIYIDPFQPGDNDNYIAYRKRDHHHGEAVRCSVTGNKIRDEAPAKHAAHAKVSSGESLRTYRLAMAATGEYTAFHGGTVADALAGIVTTVNRVNGIYERDVGVRMVLVADNDKVIYTNAGSDPYANTSNDLGANISTLNARIGSANYDVGHLVGTGGGGVAYLGVICSGSKGAGLTGSPSPAGDAFDVDYVAHELGHQFSGNHTFNGSGENCTGGNREPSTAYEPGSGVTIQAYAGICGTDDLQPNSEDHFHRVSLDEIIAHTTDPEGGGACGVLTPTGNAVPTVAVEGASFAIPANTPFELSATGADANGDTLTYSWEQFDLGTANPAGSLADNGTRPIFRAFAPSRSGTRIFPSLRYILDDANVPPQTTGGYFTGEVLPSTDRTMTFHVTVRDNRAGGGGTNMATTSIDVEPGTPFAITAPDSAGITWAAGSSQAVTWNVGNTVSSPVSAASVAILLSLDGGHTWPVVLAASEPNDGAATVTLPAGTPSTSRARIKVKAVGNVFFDISNADLAITGSNGVPVVNVIGSVAVRQGGAAATANVATLTDNPDAPGALAVSVTGAPPELSVTADNIGGNVSLTATAACTLVAPSSGSKIYPVRLHATDSGNATGSASVDVLVSANRAPTLGAYSAGSVDRGATAMFSPSGGPADADGNYAGISVSPATLPGGGTVSVAANGNISVTATAGTALGAHTVRVTAADACGAVEIRQLVVTITSSTPSLQLLSHDVASGNGLLEPNECNTLALTVANGGAAAATGAVATLSTLTPDVTITQPVAVLGDIPAGQARTTLVPFDVSTGNALVCLTDIDFNVSISYGGGGSPFVTQFTRQVGRAAALDYSFTAAGGGTLPTTTGPVSGSVADDALVSVMVPAGFSFSLYGNPVAGGTILRASTNGTLQFQPTGGSLEYDNGGLPNEGDINYETDEPFPASAPTLFGWWDDLETSVNGGGIFTATTGTAPNRQWVVEWRGKHVDANGNTANIRFGMVFNEGVDGFEFVYPQVGSGVFTGGASATIGVQGGSDGPRFTQYSLNGSTPVTAGTRLVATRLPEVCSTGSGTCTAVPAVFITPSGGNTVVTEGGAGDSYEVVLATEPTGDVFISIAAIGFDIETDRSALTFTTLNWNVPQTVVVSAINDRSVEGAATSIIHHYTSGGGYSSVLAPTVAVDVQDNDSATYRFDFAEGSIDESENQGIGIRVVLDMLTDGEGLELFEEIRIPVTVLPASTATAGVDYQLYSTFVPFYSESTSHVALTIAPDALVEGNETFIVQLGTETGGSPGQQAAITLGMPDTYVLTIIDDDVAGVTLVESEGDTLVTEDGGTDSYTLALNTQPTSSVTVDVIPGAGLSAHPMALTFTAANWNVPQTVTVAAIDDGDIEGAHAGSITHSASGGGYDAVSIAALDVAIADNDGTVDLAVNVTRLPDAVTPGENVSFEIAAANLSTVTDVAGAALAVGVAPALLDLAWTCMPDPGAACPASGTGLPSHAVTLPRDSGVLYTLTGRIPAGTVAGTAFTATATIAVPDGADDPNPANDSASATATLGELATEIFADGFE